MKRIYLLLLLFIFISTSCKAQILMGLIFGEKLNTEELEFGFAVGLNYSNLSNSPNTKYLAGLKFGSNFYYKFDDKKQLHLETLAYNDHGAGNITPYSLGDENLDLILSTATVTRRLRYMSAQLTFRYRLYDHLYTEIGSSFSYLPNAFDEFTTTTNNQEIKVKNNVTSRFNRIELGPVFLISYKLLQGEGMSINFGFYHGLVNIIKDTTIKNVSFQLGVSFPVGKGG